MYVMLAEPTIDPTLAVIREVPGPVLATRPSLETSAAEEFDEIQDTTLVKSCELLSLYVPVAVNCWDVPSGTVRFAGPTAIDCSTAPVIVNGAEPLMLFRLAMTVTLP